MHLSIQMIRKKAEKHWAHLMEMLSKDPSGAFEQCLFRGVAATYEQPERAYHNLGHILSMLEESTNLTPGFDLPPEFLLAIWLHDYVYELNATDNEEKSAVLAMRFATILNLPKKSIDTVQRLVLATKHSSRPGDLHSKMIADLDLVILGKSSEVFDRYEAAIRREYITVSDNEYRAGRIRVLLKFLKRLQIYSLPHFCCKYEQQARRNLERTVEKLGS